jgi:hypothetical protein
LLLKPALLVWEKKSEFGFDLSDGPNLDLITFVFEKLSDVGDLLAGLGLCQAQGTCMTQGMLPRLDKAKQGDSYFTR